MNAIVTNPMFGARGDGATDDRVAIQRAIDSGLDVVFPSGTYAWAGTISFNNANQRVSFMAGAQLLGLDATAAIEVTGASQVITGLHIEGGTGASPLVTFTACPGTMVYDLNVYVNNGGTLVSIDNLTKLKFHGGQIKGTDAASTVGLHITTTGGYEIAASYLTVHHVDIGVLIDGNADEINFWNCNFENCASVGLDITSVAGGTVYSLGLYSCHFEGSLTNLRVSGASSVLGGGIWNTRFSTNGAYPRSAIVINTTGGVNNLRVANCFLRGVTGQEANTFVWNCAAGSMYGVFDDLNYWDHCTFATGANASMLTRLSAPDLRGLQLSAWYNKIDGRLIIVDPTLGKPAAAGSTGIKGQIAWDTSYLYICTDTNTWTRVALAW